jgi:hypothetical protein
LGIKGVYNTIWKICKLPRNVSWLFDGCVQYLQHGSF